ncbi:glycosyltransferase family 2 protein [uncultured Roseobacter sp.]|uniref:glycosyltransferase family 2 protein n=1 Tax=uncultured Roseobacter sp. TaxID=114847 RepID=UPI0026243E50|nr:glycosyltransferase family 2 protein [uncultured Roseobacter sp.]
MPHRIAVSIINYRTAALTLQCVRSVLDVAGGLDVHVVVVDNCSGDGSAEEIAAWIDARPGQTPVELVRSDSNTGFSGGHNQGIAACEADWYLVLNSDALLRPGFFTEILKVAESHPDAGLIVPRLEGEDEVIQPNCFRFPGPVSELLRSASTGFVSRLFRGAQVSLGPEPEETAIEWASFACILLRREMIAQTGPMDEGYFLYFEDAEYCLRARRAGWPIARAPLARAVHFRGGSGPVKAMAAAKKRLPAYFYSSRSRFLYQAHGHAGLILANVMWHLGRVIAHARRLTGRPAPGVAEAEARDIWINARDPLGPRNAPGEQA